MTAAVNTPRPPAPPKSSPSAWPWGGLYIHLAVIVLLLALGVFVDLWVLAPLWGLYAIAVVVLFYRDGGSLLGPVFFYDLVRTSRKGRHIVLRCAYATLLLAVLFAIYANRFAGRVDPRSVWQRLGQPANQMPDLPPRSSAAGDRWPSSFCRPRSTLPGPSRDKRERRT
jgi:hypothetical protein